MYFKLLLSYLSEVTVKWNLQDGFKALLFGQFVKTLQLPQVDS